MDKGNDTKDLTEDVQEKFERLMALMKTLSDIWIERRVLSENIKKGSDNFSTNFLDFLTCFQDITKNSDEYLKYVTK